MAFCIPKIEAAPVVPGRMVLIDADVIAYLGSFGTDDMPLNAALAKTKQRWNQVLAETQAESCKGYLTGDNNFRDDIATLQRYKGNRYDEAGKRIKPQPKWLPEVRQHLIDVYNCTKTPEQEADDALGIHAKQRRDDGLLGTQDNPMTIISSVDKDLRINPGCHHNMSDGYMSWTEGIGHLELDVKDKVRGSGLMFFYAQMIMGDSADWIKGLPYITEHIKDKYKLPRKGPAGPKAAYYLLKDCTTEEELELRVWSAYFSYWVEHGYKHWRTGRVYTAGYDTAYKQFIEQGRLLWVRRKEGELWEPKVLNS